MISYTRYPSLYATSQPTTVTESWPELVARFGTHLRVDRKDQAPGFGPYMLKPGGVRNDRDVLHMTMAMFDVDCGTPEQIADCAKAIEAAQLMHFWYSTFSHRLPDKPSYRLVIPFGAPVDPAHWPTIRKDLLTRFGIPADPAKCSAPSHFYYLPSCPTTSATPPEAWYLLDTLYTPPAPPPVSLPTRAALFAAVADESELDASPTGPVDLSLLRDRLKSRAASYGRKGEREKAELTRRVLEGEPLAEHGSRNQATAIAAGIVAWTLPECAVSTIVGLLRPSVEAMVSEGSSLKIGEVERMVRSALAKKKAADQADRAMNEALKSFGNRWRELANGN